LYTSLPESPQGIGDLTGLAYRLVRRNIATIFRFILVPSIFTVAGGVLLQWIFTYGTSDVAATKSVQSALLLGLVLIAALILTSIAWWILGIRLLALTRTVLGFAASLEEAQAYMSRRKWGLAGLYGLGLVIFGGAMFLWFIVIMVGVFAGTVVGATSGGELVRALIIGLATMLRVTGLVATVTIYLVISQLAFSVFACEDSPVTTVIGRSLQLAAKHFMRVMVFGMLFAVMFSVISYPLSLPVAAVAFVDALQHGLSSVSEGGVGQYKPPLYVLVLTQTWEAAMGIILRPLSVFAFGLLYYDLRLRTEGLDIKRKLAKLEAR
jgi:hypothetical protein